jgi:hypothetical protein
MIDRRYQPNLVELAATVLIRACLLPGRIRRLLKP